MMPASPWPAYNAAALPDAPAPWRLQGSAYILALKMPAQMLAHCPFTPTSLRDSLHTPLSLAMLVDYHSTPAGPYRELLFIPGSFRFQAGRLPSISRIFVSTQASVFNGRRNWGIPKDVADFDFQWSDAGPDTAVITQPNGDLIARFSLQASGPELPAPAHLVPAAWRTLAQRWEGREYVLAPSSQGVFRWARVRDMAINPAHFPDLGQGRVIAALKVPHFDMTFPQPSVRSVS